jgi:hypothetical protein
MAKKKKDLKILEWIPMGCFPGYLMFNYRFKYKELMQELDNIEATEYIRAFSEDQHHIDNVWCVMSREMENTVTGEKVTYIMLNIPDEFDFEEPYSYCKLAHEIVHVCQFHLPAILDRNVEIEAEAYFHTFLMEKVLNLIKN